MYISVNILVNHVHIEYEDVIRKKIDPFTILIPNKQLHKKQNKNRVMRITNSFHLDHFNDECN